MSDDKKAISIAPEPQEQRVIGKPFAPGNNANPAGRPKGSRNKLGEDFIAALHDDFQEHGVQAIREMRADKPAEYVKVIASLLPKEIKLTDERELSDAELVERIRQFAGALDIALGSLGELDEIAGRSEAPKGLQ